MTVFKLIPFSLPEVLNSLEIGGEIYKQGHLLSLSFELQGDLSQIAIAEPVANPTRQDNLWQTTCFEFFMGIPDQSPYWEFNLSLAGDWNCYRFTDYRHRMMPEENLSQFPFTVQRSEKKLQLSLEMDLSRLIPQLLPLEVAIASVIQTTDQDLSYWALIHPGKEADFHRRDSFKLLLD